MEIEAREVTDRIRRMAARQSASKTREAVSAGLKQAGLDPSAALEAAKPWWQSRAVIGGIIAGIGVPLAGAFGYSVSDADAEQMTMLIMGIGSAVGGILAIVGRVKATKAVKK